MSEGQKGYQTEPLEYVDLKKHWNKIERLLAPGTAINDRMRHDFGLYVEGRWGEHGISFDDYDWPSELESFSWQDSVVGRPPRFWKLVKHGACHWLVNYQLMLAEAIMPEYDWCILTSDDHSTVWNLHGLLWDANFLALKISPQEAFDRANGGLLPLGEMLEPGPAQIR